ncbi:5-aminolevulic acid synthase [Rhodobacterales bacterium HKCCE2091]|nr:5-aminolevulic acid synthase [Rhodobacterales bacterium HKCCE2091]
MRRPVTFAAAAALAAATAAVAFALPAVAQGLPDGRAAERIVFAPNAAVESVVFPHPSLNQAEVQLLSTAISQGLMPEMVYYGALAIAPDEGLANPDTTVAVGNYHDEDSASAAARARCDAARSGGAPCVTVLIVRPAGWEAGAGLQLSQRASEALRTEYRRAGSPRFLSISQSTGQYGIGGSAEAANTACGAADCRPVIADD